MIGAGAVGSRTARQVASIPGLERLVVVDQVGARAESVVAAIGAPAETAAVSATSVAGVDVVILAMPSVEPGIHRRLAESAIELGAHVVSVTDSISTVRELLALDGQARGHDRTIVIGAGFAPGLSCLLARHGAATFDSVEELHVAKAGTGGPACAREHHHALGSVGSDWRDGRWMPRPGGAGRELCFFPDPVGGQDCYGAALADPLLLVPAFPGVMRVTSRLAAKRRDRFTARLPMLRPPHPEGIVGAVRVELRGRRGTAWDVSVLGAMDRPAVAAGAVAAVATEIGRAHV